MENDINTDKVFVGHSWPTSAKARVTADGQQMIQVDDEWTSPISAELEEDSLQFMKSRLSSIRAPKKPRRPVISALVA